MMRHYYNNNNNNDDFDCFLYYLALCCVCGYNESCDAAEAFVLFLSASQFGSQQLSIPLSFAKWRGIYRKLIHKGSKFETPHM